MKPSILLPVLCGIVLLVATFALLLQQAPTALTDNEPLADPRMLEQLIAGNEPQPADAVGEPAQFHGTKVIPPSIAALTSAENILGIDSVPDDRKRIEVDLTNQKVYAYEDANRVYEFTVSTGKWGWTPTGEFRIWTKVRSQTMKGGSKKLNTYYYLPGVPWVMFFYNDKVAKMRGFSFHGTYWHNNFGHPMSHGCINMKTEEAKILYDWANPVVTNPKAWSTPTTPENPGTRVVIYGKTPSS